MRNRRITLALLAGALAAASPALAARGERERLAIVPLSSSGAGAAAVAAATVKGLLKAFRSARRVQATLLGAGREDKLRMCLQERRCVRAVSGRLRLRYLLTGHVQAQGSRFLIDLRVIAGTSGEVVASESIEVDRDDATARSVRTSAELVDQARRKVSSAPPKPGKGDDEDPITASDAKLAAAIVEQRDVEDPTLSPAERKRLAEEQAKRNAAPPLPDVPLSPHLGSSRYWHAWMMMGVGVAALGTGIVFGVIAKSGESKARDAATQPEAYKERDGARKNALVANILYAGGGAALLTSALLFVLEARSEHMDARRAAARLKAGVELAPGAGTLVVRGWF
jgi:hypothetical protein